jgi:hypothetical protein
MASLSPDPTGASILSSVDQVCGYQEEGTIAKRPSLYPVCTRSFSPCLMCRSLPCLFSQSSLLYDVQASSLFVLAVLPPCTISKPLSWYNQQVPKGSRTQTASPPLQGYGGARRTGLIEHAHPSRYQRFRPLFGFGVVVATGDSSLLRGTPCRQAVQVADVLASGKLWLTGAHPSPTASPCKPGSSKRCSASLLNLLFAQLDRR